MPAPRPTPAPEAAAAPPRARRASLRTVLVVTSTLQILFVFGLVGWLTFRNGQAAVEDLAGQFRRELTARVRQQVLEYVRQPIDAARLHAAAIGSADLPQDDPERLFRAFWQALHTFAYVDHLSFGSETGAFVGTKRAAGGSFTVDIKPPGPVAPRGRYAVSATGVRGPLVDTIQKYDPRGRPWYRRAVQAGKPVWTDIYAPFRKGDSAYITAVVPVTGAAGDIRGVVGADLVLAHIGRFLRTLPIGPGAATFIVERTGELVATSSGTPVVERQGQSLARTAALRSTDPAVRRAAAAIVAHHGGFDRIGGDTHFTLPGGDGRLDFEVAGVRDGHGLDWVLVVTIPEAMFMHHVTANTRTTVWLCLAALALSLAVAFSASRRIARPLRALSRKADLVRAGELDVPFSTASRDEVGQLERTLAHMLQGLRERDAIRDTFGRYVPAEVAERLLSDPASLGLGGQLQRVAVLLADLRGFTRLTETLAPARLVRLLNRYLAAMSEILLAHRGTILEFIGDAVLAVFGAPLQRPDDARRAACSAVRMQNRMAAFNAESAADGLPAIEMGIGITFGDVVAGNLGGERVAKYGIVGEPVNLVARIQNLTVGGQILVSQAFGEALGAAAVLGETHVVQLKGVAAPVRVSELLGLVDEAGCTLAARPAAALRPVDWPAHCLPVEGAALAGDAATGRVVGAAADLTQLELALPTPLPVPSRVALRLEPRPGAHTAEIYATVTAAAAAAEPGAPVQHTLVVTSITAADRVALGAGSAADDQAPREGPGRPDTEGSPAP